MVRQPETYDIQLAEDYSTNEGALKADVAKRNQSFTKHILSGEPTTDGVRWSAVTCTTGTPCSKSSNIVTVGDSTYTISWPGLDGWYVTDLEVGLVCGIRSTKGDTRTTIGFEWEYKDDDETTWTGLTTFHTFATSSTIAYLEITQSGYPLPATGYNKLPLELRLRAYSKTTKSNFKIKNSSYVKILGVRRHSG